MSEQKIEIFFPMSERTLEIPITQCSYILSALRGPDSGAITPKAFGTAVVRHCVKGWIYGFVINPSGLYGRLAMAFKKSANPDLAEAILGSLMATKHHYANHTAQAFESLAKHSLLNDLQEDERFFTLLEQIWRWKNEKELKMLYHLLRDRTIIRSPINFSKLTPDIPKIQKNLQAKNVVFDEFIDHPKNLRHRKPPFDSSIDLGKF